MLKKYQIFVSSTYNDLIEERSAAINAIISQRQIPAGMEFFGAMGEKQWDYIKKEINNSDYYLLIIAGKYGSVNEQDISYTEAEFDYACSRGIRVLAFLAKDIETIPAGKSESTKKRKSQLAKFRSKVEKNAGLVAYWTDKYDLALKVGTSLANVLREYPAETGWIRIDKETNAADFFNKGPEQSYTPDEYEYEKCLFPELKEMPLEKPQVNYDVNDPSKAAVICGSAYVQLEARDGRIEQYMVDTCLEFVKLVEDRNHYLDEEEMFCLRSLWFNSISPEVIVYLDYLYNWGNTADYSVEHVKEMFYDGEVLGDGICYATLVRRYPVFMGSDHFYPNNREFYEVKDPSLYLKLYWEEADFRYTDEKEKVIAAELKISNSSRKQLKFRIMADFETAENGTFGGVHLLDSVYARDEAGKTMFAIDGYGSKTIKLYFAKTGETDYQRERPVDVSVYAEDDSPGYE